VCRVPQPERGGSWLKAFFLCNKGAPEAQRKREMIWVWICVVKLGMLNNNDEEKSDDPTLDPQ
jgi:hypothetical protein